MIRCRICRRPLTASAVDGIGPTCRQRESQFDLFDDERGKYLPKGKKRMTNEANETAARAVLDEARALMGAADEIMRPACASLREGERIIFWTTRALSMEQSERFRSFMRERGIDATLVSGVDGAIIAPAADDGK